MSYGVTFRHAYHEHDSGACKSACKGACRRVQGRVQGRAQARAGARRRVQVRADACRRAHARARLRACARRRVQTRSGRVQARARVCAWVCLFEPDYNQVYTFVVLHVP